MKKRFEIPIEPQDLGYNLFAVEDFLRSIRDEKSRKALLRRVGYSLEERTAYEEANGLPHGAVELAIMADDTRVQKINEVVYAKLPEVYNKPDRQADLVDLYQEIGALSVGLKNNYPDAIQFVGTYAQLSERNRRSFQGDYKFSNQELLLTQDGGDNPSPAVEVNLWVLLNLALFINAAVYANAGVATMVLLASHIAVVVVAIATSVVVTPLYGQKHLALASTL